MEPNRKAKRRLAGIASLKAILTSASVAALLGGWGLISLYNQNQSAQAASDPAAGSTAGTAADTAQTAPAQSDTQAVQPTFRERRGFDDQDGGFFGSAPSFSSPSQSQNQGSQFFMPRTRSSR